MTVEEEVIDKIETLVILYLKMKDVMETGIKGEEEVEVVVVDLRIMTG